MYVDRVEISFDAGHRLLDYPGKCASPHGHSYKIEVFIAMSQLDELGLALDFGELKGGIKEWVDEHWDHGFLINDDDLGLIEALRSVPGSKLYLFRGVNPSAEAMARELFDEAQRHFGHIVQRVRVWESPNQYAEFISDDALIPAKTRQEALP